MKKILILDDESAIRSSFTDYFEDQLWYPVQAETGEQALELMARESFTAAIVDIRLPGMTGTEFIRKASGLGSKTVFLICTGSPEFDVPEDLLQRPEISHRVFSKPVEDISDIEKEITRLIDHMERQ